MELKQLHYFLAIAECRNISHASDKLFITRSALNYSLLNLEKELGTPLFHRLSSGLVLTAAGERFQDYANTVVNQTKDIIKVMADYGASNEGKIRIGVTTGGGQASLSAILPVFHAHYPNYTFEVAEGNFKYLEQCVLTGRADLAWYGSESLDSGLDCLYVRQPVSFCLGVHKDHPIVRRYQLDPASPAALDLRLFKDADFVLMNNDSFVSDISQMYFRYAKFEPHVIMNCSSISIAASFVSSGMAVSFLPANISTENGTILLFPVEPRVTIRSSIFYRQGSQFNEAEKYLIELIKQDAARPPFVR